MYDASGSVDVHPDAIWGEPSCAWPLGCSGTEVWRVHSANLEHIPGPNYTTGALSKRSREIRGKEHQEN
ncbi:hypothetical protein MGYG_05925 [Nannizzia gypsea CBS 118893]|uniref:Uncharacterized protein n=1 Tax=Arthroderma gypseum (strain ATCC MYA-4604 / CBS 118893) TaxID=535722 RepID=E4UZY7_ARTGP|nr:hypothetical protein MGYG_05925 [Nannizzia gypsea CBS 118893]EFR02924.1 hypothetical protein MGYG_05925 [Nannizzia gypsea CBS 118893]